MKKVGILACAVLFLSIPGFAQAPKAPLSQEVLKAALGLEPASGACRAQPGPGQVLFASKGPVGRSACSAMANCGSTTLSCTGNSSCMAADSACPGNGFAGYVTCDGHTQNCPACVCAPRDFCCQCGQTDDCVTCCRCNGGTLVQCSLACG